MDIRLPDDFTVRMKDMLGDSYGNFISCYDKPAVKSLRINRRKILPVDYARMSVIFTGSDIPESVPFWEGAYYYDDDGPGKSPYHEAGAFYIQEASAMLPVTLLDVSDCGQTVLDLCAAPGGKTTQIADLMEGRGLLVSNEIIPSRASVLSSNVERLGVENALVISAEPTDLAARFPMFFDRILVDAPCSGEGMFRKNPEAVSEWSPANVRMCADRQDMLLDCAADMLAANGKIVYSTCTFSFEEDEGTVDRFLARHPEFTICDEPTRLYPHTFRGEGHFAASFVRADSDQSCKRCQRDGSFDNISKRCQKNRPFVTSDKSRKFGKFSAGNTGFEGRELIDEFLNGVKRTVPLSPLSAFGESVYAVPEFMPDIGGLKVYRAGVKVGTMKKGRFEPDHALSHVLGPEDVDCYVNLKADSDEVRQYLAGMTINCDRDMKGWCLVCVDGFALGWGKATAGVLKNHYPKGLRR